MKHVKRWTHNKVCNYCISRGYGGTHRDGGCEHYRGGKTALKRKQAKRLAEALDK